MTRPRFTRPQIPQPRTLTTYRDFRTHSERLIIGLGINILDHAEHEKLCSTEYFCDGAIAYVSALNEPVRGKDVVELQGNRDKLEFLYGIYISGSGFTSKAVKRAEELSVLLYTLHLNGQIEPMTSPSGYLTELGAPAFTYAVPRGPLEMMEVIRQMYPENEK